jgi:hypothetical protein
MHLDWRPRHAHTHYHSIRVVVEPTLEPLTLLETKLHLRVDGEDDDVYIATLISAARRYVERELSIALIDTQLEVRLNYLPLRLELPVANFSPTIGRQSVLISVPGGPLVNPPNIPQDVAFEVDQTLPAGNGWLEEDSYRVYPHRKPPYIEPAVGWPACETPQDASIVVRWWAGFGPTAYDVPATLRTAMLQLIGGWFMQRESFIVGGTPQKIPFAVEQLLSLEAWGVYR